MKTYKPAELKAAANELNAVLKGAGSKTIKVVAVKPEAIAKAFHEKILEFIEAGTAAELPESVVDFYNEYMAEDEEDSEVDEVEEAEEETGVEEEKPVVKKTPAKKAAKAKATPAKKEEVKPTAKKAAPAAKKAVMKKATVPATGKKDGKKDGKSRTRGIDGESVVAKAVEAYQTLGLTNTKALKEHIEKMFPDRAVSSTVSHVVCIMKHVK